MQKRSRNIKQHGIESMCGVRAGPTPDKSIAERCDYRSTNTRFIRSELAPPVYAIRAGKHIQKLISDSLPGKKSARATDRELRLLHCRVSERHFVSKARSVCAL